MSAIIEEQEEQPARTFLKSVLHTRVRKTRGNYFRSVAVGVQFAIVHLPHELVMYVIFPMIAGIVGVLFMTVSNLLAVLRAAIEALFVGLDGRLEAVDEAIEVEFDDE